MALGRLVDRDGSTEVELEAGRLRERLADAEFFWLDLARPGEDDVRALEATNESAISHRQNDVLRLLTIISVTMLPLTVITGLFGMNVLFPGEGSHEAFWIVLAVMAAVLAGMIGFFRYKRWL